MVRCGDSNCWRDAKLPYYNVLKEGYSSIGYKHTEAVKQMLSELAKNRTHSDQTKALISKTLTPLRGPEGG